MAQDRDPLLFDVRRSVRYHDRRTHFFERMHQVTSVLTILLSGSILLQIAGAKYEPPWWLVLFSLVAAVLAAIDMVVGYAKMANLHHKLKRDFCLLEIEIQKGKSTTHVNDCSARKITIELDEPPVYRALDLLCRNEVLAADGHEPDSPYFVKVGLLKRLTCHVLSWPNIGYDSTINNKQNGKEEKVNKSTLWTIAAIALAGFIGYQYFGYTAYQEALAAQDSKQKEVVYNTANDGSVHQVEEWLIKNFNDPKSIERIEWSKVVKTEQGNYVVRYKFRAKNETGGMEIYNKAFILGSTGIVLSMTDYKS